MARLTQDNRLITISDFGLGKDTLLLRSFNGKEAISDLFEFNAEVLSENLELSPDDIVGKACTVTIQNQHKRKFHGYVNCFSFGEIAYDNLRTYTLKIVPWLWFLSKTNNHRIFQDKTVKDIVSQIFSDHDFNDYNFAASSGKVREYCIQHNESDLCFVSRLLEEDGIAYYFTHEDGKHVLHLVDQKNAYEECKESNLEYSKGTQPNSQLTSWEHSYLFKKGQWTLNDYNFKEPGKSLLRNIKTNSQFANNTKYEHYEYPGYYEYAYRDELVKIRQDAEELKRNMVKADSDCSTFYAGGKFKVAKHASKTEKGDYIITSISHSAFDTSYFSGENAGSGYENSFHCIPANIYYRPQQRHKRPEMKGPQSAIVVGPAGEEVYIDEYGRIKVQFIWDREGQMDENSSCFLRVMQTWAGNKWGASFIPRIGHEVIVEFLDGDPDRPLVVGTVYNEKNKPPYQSKTQSGIKSRSTKGASPANYNEIRFDDKLGAEEVYIQAEKDQNNLVKNDETTKVGNNRTEEVGNNETVTVGNDRTKTVNNNENSTIENDRNKTVNNNQSETIAKDKRIRVGENHTEDIGKNMIVMVGGNLSESIDGKYTENVVQEYNLKAKSITMQAEDRITLETGSAKMLMKSNGDITITGATINIKGSGLVNIKGNKVSSN